MLNQPMLNPLDNNPELMLDRNQQRALLRPIPSVIEMKLRKKDILSNGSNHSLYSNEDIQY